MELGDLTIAFVVLFGITMVVVAVYTPQINPFAPIPVNIFTPTPYNPPTPEPTPTATPPPTPIPSPSIPPTPSPTPLATPAPTADLPDWSRLGFKCEVPSHLVGELWAEEYKFSCACLIRGKYDLGVYFNVWDGCYSTTSTGWRRESCECVEIICSARRELC